MKTAAIIACGVLVAVVLTGVAIRPATPPEASFVGGAACIACHDEQARQWRGSHHDLAMAPATGDTVLGDFNDAAFDDGIITHRFMRRPGGSGDDATFTVRTEGPDGKLHDYPVGYTFGVEPLQQYLVDMPDGRKQSLTIAWDAANHRWFSLYPGRNIGPDDWLHWTQRGQNWNANCAECHSTNLRKNYDLSSDSYRTTWSEINVSCEACHGPSSRHVAWANASGLGRWWNRYAPQDTGLEVTLKDSGRSWGTNAEGKPALMGDSDPDASVQVEACARCHARRGAVSTRYEHGEGFLDHFMPQLIQENIYHPDGQILDEVYEYGSFVQSKMYRHGVRCSDCHNPHTLKLYAPGNALCTRCHTPERYDAPSHHFHAAGSPGASCVECHMPAKPYMIVDPRRDHSLRVPRPDVSLRIGTPNACTACHADKPVQWAADTVTKWYPEGRSREPHYGEVFAAAWRGDAKAAQGLRSLLRDSDSPAFVRASAASALQGYFSGETIAAAKATLSDTNPIVRAMSAALLGGAPPEERAPLLAPLLGDEARAVRHIAARSLLSVPRSSLNGDQQKLLDAAIADQLAAMKSSADNVAGRMALGGLYQDLGKLREAAEAFEAAVEMDRRNIDAQMALAELYVRMERDAEAETLLKAMATMPKPRELPQHMWDRAQGTIQYQYGLLVGSHPARRREGIERLLAASKLIPDVSRLYYNLGELYRVDGNARQAELSYLRAYDLDPQDAGVLHALATHYLEAGDLSRAEAFATRLAARLPQDPYPKQLLAEIQRQDAGK